MTVHFHSKQMSVDDTLNIIIKYNNKYNKSSSANIAASRFALRSEFGRTLRELFDKEIKICYNK